jgi:hypothetical protein
MWHILTKIKPDIQRTIQGVGIVLCLVVLGLSSWYGLLISSLDNNLRPVQGTDNKRSSHDGGNNFSCSHVFILRGYVWWI